MCNAHRGGHGYTEEHTDPFTIQGAIFGEFVSEPAKLRANLYFIATHIYCDILQVFP